MQNLFYGEIHSFIEWTYVVGAHWNWLLDANSNVYQQHVLLKLRKPILKYTLNKYHAHWLSSFKHLNLPIRIKIPVTIWQTDFMNHAFAKLVEPCRVILTMLTFCI